METTAILVDNVRDAFGQVNQFLALGLVAAISAFALDLSPAKGPAAETTDVLGIFVKMPRHVAQLALLGVCFVAGIMACIAAESARTILSEPELTASIRSAVLTQSSIATSAVGYRIGAVALPIVFVLVLLWRISMRMRTVSRENREESRNMVTLAGFFMVPYLALGLVLLRMKT